MLEGIFVGTSAGNREPWKTGVMKKCKPDTTKQTIDFWQPHYTQALTPDDAQEIVENVTGFFRVLAEWERKAQEDDRLDKQKLVDRDREVPIRGDLVKESVVGG